MSRDHIRVDLIGSERIKTSTTVEHKAIKCPYTERHSTIGDVIQVYSSSRDSRVMVFCSTKVEANELSLSSNIKISSQVSYVIITRRIIACSQEIRRAEDKFLKNYFFPKWN